MPHDTDNIGLPIDPQLRKLELYLGELVGSWVQVYGDDIQQIELVEEYRTTVEHLYELGWDGLIAADCSLPNDLMPESYKQKHPKIFTTKSNWNGPWR